VLLWTLAYTVWVYSLCHCGHSLARSECTACTTVDTGLHAPSVQPVPVWTFPCTLRVYIPCHCGHWLTRSECTACATVDTGLHAPSVQPVPLWTLAYTLRVHRILSLKRSADNYVSLVQTGCWRNYTKQRFGYRGHDLYWSAGKAFVITRSMTIWALDRD
jgi:hypothetical protein